MNVNSVRAECVDEWMVSILLGVWNGGGVCYCRPASVRWCGSCPTHPTAVLVSTAITSCTVPRQVCGVWAVSVCLCCSCGGVSSVRSSLVAVEGGAIVDGGACCVVVGGMVSEGRQCY